MAKLSIVFVMLLMYISIIAIAPSMGEFAPQPADDGADATAASPIDAYLEDYDLAVSPIDSYSDEEVELSPTPSPSSF
ncbi:hypothetical protein ACSBR2_007961 [Camellia fascicularis]